MNKKNKVPFFASLQVKYALSYFVIFAVVLVLLNTYPLMASQIGRASCRERVWTWV